MCITFVINLFCCSPMCAFALQRRKSNKTKKLTGKLLTAICLQQYLSIRTTDMPNPAHFFLNSVSNLINELLFTFHIVILTSCLIKYALDTSNNKNNRLQHDTDAKCFVHVCSTGDQHQTVCVFPLTCVCAAYRMIICRCRSYVPERCRIT